MAMDLLYVALGLSLLLFAGDSLVKGAVNLSLRLGVPALIVSLTIVAFGTSAPELLIAIKAVLDNAPGIAMGNVVGSNTANVLLVLGLPALIVGLDTRDSDTRRTFLMMIGASLLFLMVCLLGPVTWMHGLVLLFALCLILFDAFLSARKHRRDNAEADTLAPEEDPLTELEGVDPTLSWFKIAMFIALGLMGLPLGADLLVDGAVDIATEIGISQTVIGLTLVAVGTSLPELATTVMAALRRQADVVLGNVIGSNMFNLLAIIGIAGVVGDIPVPPEILRLDLWVMLAASALLAPFVFFRWPLNRAWGAAFLAGYAGYLGVLLT
ncbi:cation:H+ antiporter [Rhodovulum bhavnagarense]|uniref:Cation:H+ antiporter n=1 Tax=Rhodovulum bhavnagarense TaxID=992286 RepID=A0A4R2RJ13_9RHOB|nr:calcium/sodium antiporter [Rhodovulum bhavnagarense]TCP62844.1 cation:H+ antiporter [Rhodovulum bhavnagarense]